MTPSEIRRELLAQHEQIRIMTEVVQTIAERARKGVDGPGDLEKCILRLDEAVRAHNVREEQLLRDLVRSKDAWGAARLAVMDDEHTHAHERLQAAIRGVPGLSPGLAGVGVVAMVRLLREHMDREEAAFLNADVLNDDLVAVEQSDG
jgi:hypothetical protein